MIGIKRLRLWATQPRVVQLRDRKAPYIRWISMKYMSLVVAAAAVVWSHAHAEEVCNVVGASALAECLNKKQINEDKHLNAVYNLIMRMFEAGAVDPMSAFYYDKKRDLVAAERAWIKFRETQCAAEATMLGPASASGTVQVMGGCLSSMTEARIAYLERVAASVRIESKLCRKSADACRVD